jgi:hypothetical protein
MPDGGRHVRFVPVKPFHAALTGRMCQQGHNSSICVQRGPADDDSDDPPTIRRSPKLPTWTGLPFPRQQRGDLEVRSDLRRFNLSAPLMPPQGHGPCGGKDWRVPAPGHPTQVQG